MVRIFSVGTATLISLMAGLSAPTILADSRAVNQEAITVRLSLGSDINKKRVFIPDQLILETGKRYKLVIDNPSSEVHELDAPDLVAAVESFHVKIAEYFSPGAPIIAKVVGTPAEIEINPGGAVEWEFVTKSPGIFSMICDVEDQNGKTHTSLGMKGAIIVN